MVSVKDAFVDAWRSHRIQQGDDAGSLPDPLGRRSKEKKGKKRKKLISSTAEAGGFFVEESTDEGDGNLSEEEEVESTSVQHIPLSSIPDALATLSLPSNDEFVLSLFAQTATYTQTDARRRRRPAESEGGTGGDEKMVSFRDFERVVEVLLEADTGGQRKTPEGGEGGEEEDDEDEEEKEMSNPPSSSRRPVRAAASTANKRRRKQIQDEDIEVASSEEDDFHSVDFAAENDDEEEYEEDNEQPKSKPKRTTRPTQKSKEKSSPQKSALGGVRRSRKQNNKADDTTATDDDDDADEGHLNATQRRTVHAAFSLFTGKLRELKGEPLDDQPRLSKSDIKLLVAHVGEKIPEKEIDEMIDEGVRFFAKASSRDITRQTAKLRREAASGRSIARGEANRTNTVGIDEFAGILLKGRMI